LENYAYFEIFYHNGYKNVRKIIMSLIFESIESPYATSYRIILTYVITHTVFYRYRAVLIKLSFLTVDASL